MSPDSITPLTSDQLELVFARSASYEKWELTGFCQKGQDYFHTKQFKNNFFAYHFQPEILRLGIGPTVQGLTPRQLTTAVNQLDTDHISDHFQKSTLNPTLPQGVFILEYAMPDLPLVRDAYTSRSILLINKIRGDIVHGARKDNNPFRFRHLANAQDRFARTGQGYYLYDVTRRLFLDEPLPSRNHIAIPAKALALMDDAQKTDFIEALAAFDAANYSGYRGKSLNYMTGRNMLIIDADGHPLRVLDSFPQTERQALTYFADPDAWARFKPLWQNPWATEDAELAAHAQPSAISKKVFGPPAPQSSGQADTTPAHSTGSTSTGTRRKPKLGGVGNIHRMLSRNPAGAWRQLKQMGILDSPKTEAPTQTAPASEAALVATGNDGPQTPAAPENTPSTSALHTAHLFRPRL